MNWTQIAENYWVSPQIEEAEVATAAEQGFQVIVCNRPDGESDDQTPSQTIKSAAESHGIDYLFLPMQGPNFTPEYVTAVKELNESGKKVLAYCRSGHRSSVLFNAAMN